MKLATAESNKLIFNFSSRLAKLSGGVLRDLRSASVSLGNLCPNLESAAFVRWRKAFILEIKGRNSGHRNIFLRFSENVVVLFSFYCGVKRMP